MASSRVEQLATVQGELRDLFARKNADYGDAFAKYGPVGVIVRMEDKMQRMISISNTGINLVPDESLRDTLLDLANYATMAVMLIDETKK